jgi:hypothetical protein
MDPEARVLNFEDDFEDEDSDAAGTGE